MGCFKCPLRLTAMDGEQHMDLEALVDTGAFYTLVPAPMLRQLGVRPTGDVVLKLADGRTERYETGHAWASVDGESVPTRVVFGGDDAMVLLGAYTLEGLHLAADPVNQALVPVEIHPL